MTKELDSVEIRASNLLYAYLGAATLSIILQVDGIIRKHTVHILIDMGSTHNFLDERLVLKITEYAQLPR